MPLNAKKYGSARRVWLCYPLSLVQVRSYIVHGLGDPTLYMDFTYARCHAQIGEQGSKQRASRHQVPSPGGRVRSGSR